MRRQHSSYHHESNVPLDSKSDIHFPSLVKSNNEINEHDESKDFLLSVIKNEATVENKEEDIPYGWIKMKKDGKVND